MYRLSFALYQLLTVLSNHSYSDEQIERNYEVIKYTLQHDIGSHACAVAEPDRDTKCATFPARTEKEGEHRGVSYTYIFDLPVGLELFKMVIQVWVCSLAESWSLVVEFTDSTGEHKGASTKTLRLSLPVAEKSGKSFQQTFEDFFNTEIQKLHQVAKAESCLGKDYLDRCAVVQTKFSEFLTAAREANIKIMLDTADGYNFVLAPDQFVPYGPKSIQDGAQVYTSTYRLEKLNDRGNIKTFSSNEYPYFAKVAE